MTGYYQLLMALKMAVGGEVMKELQDRKPLPGVPTPRDFSK